MQSQSKLLRRWLGGALALATTVAVVRAEGLLGQTYVGATLDLIDFDDRLLRNGRGFSVFANVPLSAGLDFGAQLEWAGAKARPPLGGLKIDGFSAGSAVTYYTDLTGVRPYARAAAGWAWVKSGPARDNSFIYGVEVGAELPLGNRFALTPFLGWSDAASFSNADTVDYGVRGSWEWDRSWSLVGELSRNDDSDLTLGLGVVYRF